MCRFKNAGVAGYAEAFRPVQSDSQDVYKRQAPGSAFGEQGEGYVRLSYATSMEQINRGMDRIQRFMESIM